MRMFSRRSAGYLVVATGLALTLTGPLSAQSQAQEVASRDQKQLVESLRSGGYVIVVRHGATFSDQADTDPFQMPEKGKNTFLITHKPNIIDALGKDWFDVKEGEASIFKPEDGKYRLVARVQMEDWPKLVAVK
jgi:hypothetical protein